MRISAAHPDSGDIKAYKTCALHFGTTGSVAGFLRSAAAIWFVGTHAVHLCWANYFDDYPSFAKAQDAELSDACSRNLLNVLGIKFADEGKKALCCRAECGALGLIFGLNNFNDGYVILEHTPERVSELKNRLINV